MIFGIFEKNPTMALLKDDKINYVNIGLMLITATLAFFMPFETFLLAYAFLGPLHYLTEISWLHDRQYFSKGKYDFIILLVIGVLLSIAAFASDFGYDWQIYESFVELNFFFSIVDDAGDPATEDRPGFVV